MSREDAAEPATVLSEETWRPPLSSGWLAAGLAAVGALAFGVLLEMTTGAVLAAISGGTTAVAGVLAIRSRSRSLAGASVLTGVAAAAFVGALGISVANPWPDVELAPLSVTIPVPIDGLVAALIFGTVSTAILGTRGAEGTDAIGSTVRILWRSLLVVTLPFGLAVGRHVGAFRVLGSTVSAWIAFFGGSHSPGVSFLASAVLIFLGGALVLVSSRPVPSFAIDSTTESVIDADRIATYLVWLVYVFVMVTVLAIGIERTAGFASLVGRSVASLLRDLGTFTPLRMSLFALGVLMGAAGIAVRFLRWLVRTGRDLLRWFSPATGGALVVAGILLAPTGRLVRDLLVRERFETLAGLVPFGLREAILEGSSVATIVVGSGAILAVFLALFAALVGLRTAVLFGFVPERTSGFAAAAGGLFFTSVLAVPGGAPTVALFGGIALAFVVWDLGEFATTLGEEMGRVASTRHGELVHVGAALGIGLFAAVVPPALARLRASVSANAPRELLLVAALLSVVASLLLLGLLRR